MIFFFVIKIVSRKSKQWMSDYSEHALPKMLRELKRVRFRKLVSCKLSYLHVSNLKKHNRNHEKLFNFPNLVLLKDSTFHLKDKKSNIGTLKSQGKLPAFNGPTSLETQQLYVWSIWSVIRIKSSQKRSKDLFLS